MTSPLTRLRAFQRELESGSIVDAFLDTYDVGTVLYDDGLATFASDLGALLDGLEQVRPLVEAARGLSFGEDWNGGSHAKLHGYRRKLLKALPAALAVFGLEPGPQAGPARGER